MIHFDIIAVSSTTLSLLLLPLLLLQPSTSFASSAPSTSCESSPESASSWRACSDIPSCPSHLNDLLSRHYVSLSRCDISTRDASTLSLQDFLREFVHSQTPVRIENALSASWHKFISSNLTRSAMLSAHGHEAANTVGSPDAPSHVLVADFLHRMASSPDNYTTGFPLSIWEASYATLEHDLHAPNFAIPVPPMPFPSVLDHVCASDSLGCSATHSWFILSPPLGGAPFHAHEAVFHLEAFGEKLWFLADERHARLGQISNEQLMDDEYFTDHALVRLRDDPSQANAGLIRASKKCVQRAGDILYLPEGVFHMTLSLSDTVALSFPIGTEGLLL